MYKGEHESLKTNTGQMFITYSVAMHWTDLYHTFSRYACLERAKHFSQRKEVDEN